MSQETYIIWLRFVVHKCKMMISSCACFIFSTFWFLMFLVGEKVKKWTRKKKNSICCGPYLKNHTLCNHTIHVIGGGGGGGAGGKKMAPNRKIICLSHSISQELYLIWLWCLVHMCKMMISPAIFSFFSKFIFFCFLEGGVDGQKMTLNYQF